MEEALVAFLLADAGLSALVSDRITWGSRPQASALPAVVLHRIDGLRSYSADGPSGLVSSRVQVDCWGASYGSAKGLGRAVIARLSGYVGTTGGVQFQAAFAIDERDGYERGDSGADIYRSSIDFDIWHAEG